MNHHSFKSSYNYLIFGTLRPSSFYFFYQEKWYPYRKLISRCKCSCLSVSLALNACACNRWPDFTWRPPAISFSVFQNSLGSRQIIFLPGTYHCSYFRVTCWIYYSNKFYDFNFDETLYQIQWLVRWFYEKKRFLIGCDVVWNVKIRDRLQRFYHYCLMICVSYQQNTDMLMSFQLKQFYKSTYCTTMFCQTSLITGIVSFIQRNHTHHMKTRALIMSLVPELG